MLFLCFLLIFCKLAGMFFVYQVHLPDRFPPETTVTQIGYFIFNYFNKLIHTLNLKISLFPSVLVPIVEQTSTKLLFLRLPFILIDFVVVIIALVIMFKKRKGIYSFLFFSSLNFWIIFYFSSQRLSFKEEIYKFFLKAYKLSLSERLIIDSGLAIYFVLLSTVSYLLLKPTKFYQKFMTGLRKFINFRFFQYLGTLLLVVYFLNFSGIFLKMSQKENVDWKGYWVWSSGNSETNNLYLIFEKDVDFWFRPSEANIFLACQSDYQLFINNKFVGQGGLVAANDLTYYEGWPVAEYLNKGRNKIKIECYNPYLETLSLVKKQGGMIFQLEAKRGILKKGVVSNSSWKVAVDRRYQLNTERVSLSTGYQQIFNDEFSDFVWKKAQMIDKPPLFPWKELKLRPIPLLQRNEVFPEKLLNFGQFKINPKFNSPDLAIVIGNGYKIISSPLVDVRENGFFKENGGSLEITGDSPFVVLDFGRIVVGTPQIIADFEDKGIVDFGFAETLKPDQTPDVAKMVSQADRIEVSKGHFSYQWFQRRAFRYAILVFNGFKKPIKLEKFSLQAVNYPVKDNEGYFISSDKVLNEIFKVAKYTAEIARQGNFEDCPHREKAQYVGDMRIVSFVNYYNFSDKKLIEKALWEFALSQEPDGFVRAVYPAGRRLLIPDYSAQWVSAVWEYYLYSGNLQFLKQIYPFVQKQINGFINYSDEDGLVRSQPDWWIFIDQGDQEMNLDKSISLNIFYLEALKSIANAANELGNKADAEKYEKLGEDVSKLINDKAWNNKTGLYDDCITGNSMCDHFSKQTNYLALYQNIVDPKRLNVLKHNLLNNHSLPDIITPYFNSFVVEALFKNKFSEEAINLVRNYWGGMIKNGATTFWETYDPKTGRESAAFGESLSHGWSSGPAYLLPKWILGVEPLEPGYLSFRVEPVFIDLNYAKGKIPIDQKKSIEIDWKKEGHLEVNIKYNFPAKAEVSLPYHGEKKTVINDNQIKELKYDGSKIKFWINKPGDYKIVLSD